jgi:hypothetical protein
VRTPEAVVVDGAVIPGRRRLRAASRLLVGYGVVGIIAAAVAIVFLVVGLGRVNALANRVDDLGGIGQIMDRTATVLEDAASSARGFASTIDGSTSALTKAAGDVREVVPRLRELETQATALSILGAQPLAPLGSLFGQIASQLDDLDERLDSVGTALASNRVSLDTNATSLADLAAETRRLSDKLGGDALPSAIDDIRWLVMALVVIAAAGALVPAIGALGAGLWLRRAGRAGSLFD